MERTNKRLFIFWSAKQRIIHIVLFVASTLALISGLPFKYYEFSFAKYLFDAIGLTMLKVIHNAMGILIIITVIIHLSSILYVWIRSEKFIKLIEMKFTKADLISLKDLFSNFIFVGKKPEYGRYTLFQKIDYYFSLICLIVLSITGLFLMFPVASVAFTSAPYFHIFSHLHSSMAVLFTVFILVSHLFNTHVHPDKLYFNTLWLTGNLSEEKMKKFHTLEYNRIMQKEIDLKDEMQRKAEEKQKESQVKKDQNMLEDYLKEGNAMAQSGDYDNAIEKYKEAIEIYPNFSQAKFNLGVVYKKNNQFKDACDTFKDFIDMDPFNEKAEQAKSIIKELKKQLDKDSDG